MAAQKIDASFSLSNPWGFPRYGMPIRCSIPLAQGQINDPAKELALLDENGRDAGAQWQVLSTWKDGSTRHALLNYAEPTLEPREKRSYRLTRRADVPVSRVTDGIQVQENEDNLTIDTGRLRWTFSKLHFSLAESIHFQGREWIGGQRSDLLTVDMNGQIYRASRGNYSISFEEKGPHRVIVLLEGDHANALGTFMNYKLRLHFTCGGSQVLLSHTIRNRHGGREGRDLQHTALVGGLNFHHSLRRILHTARTLNTIQAPVEVPENVDIDITNRGIFIRNAASLREDPDDICYSLRHGIESSHKACAPLIDLCEPGVGGLLFKFAMPSPDEEAPMRLASEENRFEIDFYPHTDVSMHLNEGMGKTRDVLFNLHDDSLSAMDVMHDSDILSYPGVVAAPREMYRECEFADMHLTIRPQPNKYPMLESKIEHTMFEGPNQNKSGIKAIPLINQVSGWREFGDVVGHRGRMLEWGITQYYNNEEDYIHCSMLDAWRLGKPHGSPRFPRHLMDIDYIDFSTDPGRDGADCPHSTNHTDGEVYPSHQWCQGLLYYYVATGDHEALRISKRIGDNLIWWITGPRRNSLTYSGRESAWPLLSLAALYDVTHEEKYRDAAMIIIDNFKEAVEEHGQLAFEYPPGSGIHSSYMLPMTFNGIWDVYAATGDESILELWKRVTGPTVDDLDNPNSLGYIHFRNQHLKWPDLTTLARWYYLTGDEKYIQLGKNGLRLVLIGCPQPMIQDIDMLAMGYRHYIFFLKLADEHGMINDDICSLVW